MRKGNCFENKFLFLIFCNILADKSRSRKAGGSELGLSIVKGIIEMHRGSIDVQSQQANLIEQENLISSDKILTKGFSNYILLQW